MGTDFESAQHHVKYDVDHVKSDVSHFFEHNAMRQEEAEYSPDKYIHEQAHCTVDGKNVNRFSERKSNDEELGSDADEVIDEEDVDHYDNYSDDMGSDGDILNEEKVNDGNSLAMKLRSSEEVFLGEALNWPQRTMTLTRAYTPPILNGADIKQQRQHADVDAKREKEEEEEAYMGETEGDAERIRGGDADRDEDEEGEEERGRGDTFQDLDISCSQMQIGSPVHQQKQQQHLQQQQQQQQQQLDAGLEL